MNNYNDRYNLYLKMINKRLDELLISSTYNEDIVCDAMRYSIENGGKRIRPILVLEACNICGGNVEDALDFACALEMIHTYSLIHDDLPCMDDDKMRRGKPSCHVKYGEEYALLAGDGLLTYAFHVLTLSKLNSEQIVKAIRLLSENAGFNGMIGGQVVDLKSENKTIEYETLHTMHSLKTGALIRAAVELGCIAANADADETEKLINYADKLGLAFQIVDDILDVTGTEEELGKPIGSDAVSKKTTFVTLFGIDEAKSMVKKTTSEAIDAISQFKNNEFLTILAEKLTVRKS